MAITAGICDSYTLELLSGVHTNTDTYKIASSVGTATVSAQGVESSTHAPSSEQSAGATPVVTGDQRTVSSGQCSVTAAGNVEVAGVGAVAQVGSVTVSNENHSHVVADMSGGIARANIIQRRFSATATVRTLPGKNSSIGRATVSTATGVRNPTDEELALLLISTLYPKPVQRKPVIKPWVF